jgi:hypothetical protein
VNPSRRSFLQQMLVCAAAPAVVRASTLMRIKPILLPGEDFIIGDGPGEARLLIHQGNYSKALWPGIKVWWDQAYSELHFDPITAEELYKKW